MLWNLFVFCISLSQISLDCELLSVCSLSIFMSSLGTIWSHISSVLFTWLCICYLEVIICSGNKFFTMCVLCKCSLSVCLAGLFMSLFLNNKIFQFGRIQVDQHFSSYCSFFSCNIEEKFI
jgi:hypothetical protein